MVAEAGGGVRRYEALDGLRGVAAVGVLVYHINTYAGAPALLPHGYVAVDFFFMLSGFVLAHAYSERLHQIPFRNFVRSRLIRLLPLSLLGLALGTTWLVTRHYMLPMVSVTIFAIVRATMLNLFLVPDMWSGPLSDYSTFPADGPLWSLSLELMINIFWGKFLFRIRIKNLVFLCVISFASFAFAAWWYKTLGMGPSNLTWIGGNARAVFGFFLGVLLWRFRPTVRPSRWKIYLSVALLVGAMAVPDTDWLASLIITVLVLPGVLWLAASASYRSERPTFRLLGDLSYPLYVIQIPVFAMFCGFLKASHLGDPTSAWTYALVPLLVVAALMLDRVYDRPLRRVMTQGATRTKREATQARAAGSL